MGDSKCFICDDFLTNKESVVIKERGLKTLIDSSKRRKDGDVGLWLFIATAVNRMSKKTISLHHCPLPKILEGQIF